MKDEIINEIISMLKMRGIEENWLDIRNELLVIMKDADITPLETAIVLADEAKNEKYLKRFITCKMVEGCTTRTVRGYGYGIKRILERIGKNVEAISTDDIRLYLALRETRDGITKSTADSELRYLKTFFKFLYDEELINHNPTTKIKKIKGPKINRPAFSEMDIEKIRKACDSKRETAMVEALLSTGCRVSELAGIKLSEIKGNEIVVHGKGEKDRKVYLNAKAQFAIQEYLAERKDKNIYLFAGGNPEKIRLSWTGPHETWYTNPDLLNENAIDKCTIEKIIREIGKKAGVENCHPHRFRRTCATLALRRGMPIEQVSKMLGHEQLSTTQIYLDLDEESLELMHKKFVV